MSRFLRFIPVALALCLAGPLAAQAGPTLSAMAEGTRLRVTAPAAYQWPLKGRLVALRNDTLFLTREGVQSVVLVQDIEAIEVHGGGAHPALVGAGVGAGLFGAAGYFGFQMTQEPPRGTQMVATVGSAAVGALVGTLFGAMLPERWRRVFPR